jgi:hypothetical protein
VTVQLVTVQLEQLLLANVVHVSQETMVNFKD